MLKKLELIIGSIIAGNNSKELRNRGVSILDQFPNDEIKIRDQKSERKMLKPYDG